MFRLPKYLLALPLLTFAGSARAADRPYTVAYNSPALALFPELKTAPAPTWVKPGTRITFYDAAATIPSSYQMPPVLDPNGNLVDPTTGKSVRMDANASASGHGIVQLDVIALTNDAVVCRTNTYVINGLNGPATLADASGFVTLPGAAYDWWANPEALKKAVVALGNGGAGVRVAKGPYTAAGKTFDAVWISTSGNGASTSYVVDPAGGLILHSATCTSTGGGTTLLNGVPTATGGSLSIAQNTFVGMRTVAPPWAGAPLPASIAKVRTMVYEGAKVTSLGTTVSWPMRITVKITGHGDNFVQVHKNTWLNPGNGVPITADVDSVSGPGEFLPLAIPPEYLTKFRMGQELDRDPFTKVGIGYSGTRKMPNGHTLAILTETAGPNTMRTDYGYDLETGLLGGIMLTDPASFSQTTVMLRSAE